MQTLLAVLSVVVAAATVALLGGYLLAILAALRRVGGGDESQLARLAAALEGTAEGSAALPVRLDALERRLDELRETLVAVQADLDAAALPLFRNAGVGGP